jgi:hypothetical protein
MSNDNQSKVNLRLDAELRQQIKDAAKQSLRSLQTEIEYRLRSTFDRKSDESTAS